jgi:phosphatidylglycerol:prolipoprotein diacylglycerol transferase
MHPTLLSWPPIPSYGAMLVLATAAGWLLARRRARGLGLAAWQIDWLIPLLILGCAAGGRLAAASGGRWFAAGTNERVLFGAIVVSVAVAVLYGLVLRIPLGRLADAFAASLLMGIGLLRVGCFLAGCCWGDVCADSSSLAAVLAPEQLRQIQTLPALCGEDVAVRIRFPAGSPACDQHRQLGLLHPEHQRSLPVHPVQLYEAFVAWALLGGLLAVDRSFRRYGEAFLAAGVAYTSLRFCIEWFRADQPLVIWGWTFSQLCCVPLVCLCTIVWTVRVQLSRKAPDAYLHRG